MILMTGGTGGIGSELLRSEAGVGARALARNPQKAQKLQLEPLLQGYAPRAVRSWNHIAAWLSRISRIEQGTLDRTKGSSP